jgi:hypothetical protein
LVPIDHLPWAQVALPVTENEGSTSNLREGTTVFGIYLDGEEKQVPFVLGVVPGIHNPSGNPNDGFNDPRQKVDANVPGYPMINGDRIAEPEERELLNKGDKTVSKYNRGDIGNLAHGCKAAFQKIGVRLADDKGLFDEPSNPFAAKYPYNNAHESESGHVIELDDTPGSERVHIFHRAGTYIEVHPDGTVVKKTQNTDYEFVSNNKVTAISKNCHSVVEESKSLRVGTGYTIEVTDNDLKIDVLSGNCNIYVNGDCTTTVTGKYTVNCDSAEINVAKDMTTNCGGGYAVNAARIDWN